MREWIIILIDCMGSSIAMLLVTAVLIVCIWGVLALFNVFRKWGNKYQDRKIELLKERKKLIEAGEDVECADNNYLVKTIITAFVAAIILILAAIIANKEWGLKISSDHVVLSFVGIIATFIVITNHVQTNELSRRVDKQLEKNKQEMDTLRTESKTAQDTWNVIPSFERVRKGM